MIFGNVLSWVLTLNPGVRVAQSGVQGGSAASTMQFGKTISNVVLVGEGSCFQTCNPDFKGPGARVLLDLWSIFLMQSL